MKTFLSAMLTSIVLLVYAQRFNYPPSRTVEVADNYFGNVISDPYRWLEDMNSPEVQAWFRTQSDFSKQYLDRISGRDHLLAQIKTLANLKGDAVRNIFRSGDFYYFTKILKGASFGNLYRRNRKTGTEELFFDGQQYKKGSQIKQYVVNQQQNMMALKIQDEGSELCEVIFMRLPEKKILKDRLYPIWSEFDVSFLPDGKSLLYTQMTTSDLNSKEVLKNMAAKLHVIGDDVNIDRILASAGNNPELGLVPERFPSLSISTDGKYVFLSLGAAANYTSAFYTETKNLGTARVAWKPLIRESDQISQFFSFGDQLFFSTFKEAPNFRIGVTRLTKPDFENAKFVVPQEKEVITLMNATKNNLFFAKSNGVTQNVYRLDPKNFKIEKLELPGGVNIPFVLNADKTDEIVIVNTNWLTPYSFLEYDPKDVSIPRKSIWMNKESGFPDFEKQFQISEIEIPGHDGVMIPLSLIYPKNMKKDGNSICYITGYGGYGISFYPIFLGAEISFLQQGGMIAIAHVRGGGEKGEEWHQMGMKGQKANTWKDFISASEYLIQEGYTSSQKLIGEGTSAGGILIGRAVTERPDLFAVAVNNVGMTQVLRSENTANGDNHIPEMGSVKNKDDISALIEMDAQSKIKTGVKYPAIYTITGINDARVVPWMPAKFTAAMQASTSSDKPVFLWVNYRGGHAANDLGDYQTELANLYSFLFWQTGHPDFQLKME